MIKGINNDIENVEQYHANSTEMRNLENTIENTQINRQKYK